jgi:hypothetical protein
LSVPTSWWVQVFEYEVRLTAGVRSLGGGGASLGTWSHSNLALLWSFCFGFIRDWRFISVTPW